MSLNDINKHFYKPYKTITVYHLATEVTYQTIEMKESSHSIIPIHSDNNSRIKSEFLINSPSNPVAKLTIRRFSDLDYQKSIDNFSFSDIRFDPENTLGWSDELKASRIAELQEISAEFPKVFGGDIE